MPHNLLAKGSRGVVVCVQMISPSSSNAEMHSYAAMYYYYML